MISNNCIYTRRTQKGGGGGFLVVLVFLRVLSLKRSTVEAFVVPLRILSQKNEKR